MTPLCAPSDICNLLVRTKTVSFQFKLSHFSQIKFFNSCNICIVQLWPTMHCSLYTCFIKWSHLCLCSSHSTFPITPQHLQLPTLSVEPAKHLIHSKLLEHHRVWRQWCFLGIRCVNSRHWLMTSQKNLWVTLIAMSFRLFFFLFATLQKVQTALRTLKTESRGNTRPQWQHFIFLHTLRAPLAWWQANYCLCTTHIWHR